jgi:hypothetical protein
MGIELFLHNAKALFMPEAKDFATSFKPDFEPIVITASTTRQLVMVPQPRPVEMSWLGFTVRDTSSPGVTKVYVSPTMTGEGKELPMALAYYERGTDHRPVQATYYSVWTSEGTATVEVDGEYW